MNLAGNASGLPPRHITQPGPENPERLVAVAAQGRAFTLPLPKGLSLLEAVRRGFAAEGFNSGSVEFSGLALGPFGYVMPALSKTGQNAAFYSDIFRPAGVTQVTGGALTFGLREGNPFFHCHGLWQEADGKISGGHMLPDETFIAADGEATALGLSGATFVAEPDAEINFTVFGPVKTPPVAAKTSSRVIALRPRPNQDFHAAIATVCARHGIKQARIRGGVGSTIGAVFETGPAVSNFATEVFIEHGLVTAGAVTLDVGLIDYTGQRARGRLKPGANPVLMTFELIIEET